jgi:outer membrane protein assembly factor BamB
MLDRQICTTWNIIVAALLFIGMSGAAATWDHAHGDAANRGFIDVDTAPAANDLVRVAGLGPFAIGAGPVIAPDGTVYLGNRAGLLKAFAPDGALKWMRDTPGHEIVASPVIGADGSIHVVGARTVRDHRDGQVVTRNELTLYRFSSTGAMVWAAPFPEGTLTPAQFGTGVTSAAPNIWRSGATEVILVPVLHRSYNGHVISIVAFSTGGGVMFNQPVTTVDYGDVAGGASVGETLCGIFFFLPPCFLEETVPVPEPNELPPEVNPPMPSVALFTSIGNEPFVVVADNYQNIVGYTFSPEAGFQENFRKHITNDERGISMSSPVMLGDGHSVVRGNSDSQGWALFAGPHPVNWTEVVVPHTGTTPTITGDGKIVMVDRAGGVTFVSTYPNVGVVEPHIPLASESIAPAAASRTHIFVSGVDKLYTIDAASLEVVEEFLWEGGGLSSPAISADGRVYALAGDTLYGFSAPPSRCPPGSLCPGTVRPPIGPGAASS